MSASVMGKCVGLGGVSSGSNWADSRPVRGPVKDPVLRRKFAVHEILSGLLLGSVFVPIARAISVERVTPPALSIDLPALTQPLRWVPGVGLAPNVVLGWGILLLTFSLVAAVMFANFLRTSVSGFEVRATGSNPL